MPQNDPSRPSISTIRLILEYKSFPMWLCDEKGILIEEGIPDVLTDDLWLRQELNDIQEEYNSLFVDTKIEFYYADFPNEEAKIRFCKRLCFVSQYIKEKLGHKYPIRDNFGAWLQRQDWPKG